MCVIFFYVNSKPEKGGYKLILASNRDEFYARDTLSASKWPDTKANYVYGGIDLEPGREGGTWLAISEHSGIFKVGALLNLTGEPKARDNVELKHTLHHHNYNHQHLSHHTFNNNEKYDSNKNTTILPLPDNHFLLGRGMIVSEYIDSIGSTIENYTSNLVTDCTKYNAFNFIAIEIGKDAEPARISLCSNVPPTLEQYCEGKCYGFGNSLPTMPFEKVRVGQKRFENIVAETLQHTNKNNDLNSTETSAFTESKLINNLQHLLKCDKKCWPDNELKRRAPNWGENLSALNVRITNEGFGSRTHTIILIDSNNRMLFVEDTMATLEPDGEWSVTSLEQQF